MSVHRRIKVVLPTSRAGSLDLVGGELAWDLTNTSSGRGSPANQEHLRDFDTLMQWVEHARVMPPSDCAYARAALAGHPRRSRRIFERTIEMRELIWTIGTALVEQRPVLGNLLASLSAAHAENLKHAETKKIMARIAEDYERIVKIVEQHLRDIRQILSKISS